MSVIQLHPEQHRLRDSDRLYVAARLLSLGLILVFGQRIGAISLLMSAPGGPAALAWLAYAIFGLVVALGLVMAPLHRLLPVAFLGDLVFLFVLLLLMGRSEGVDPRFFYPFFFLPALRGAVRPGRFAPLVAGSLGLVAYLAGTLLVRRTLQVPLEPSELVALLAEALVLGMAPVMTSSFAQRLGLTNSLQVRQAELRAAASLRDAEDYRNRMRALYEVAYALSTTNNYQRVLDTALAEGQRLVGATTSMVLLSTGEPDEVAVTAGLGLRPEDLHQRIQVGAGVIGTALHAGGPQLLTEAGLDPDLSQLAAMRRCQAAMCVPLSANHRTYGVVVVACDQPGAYSVEHLELIATLANYAIIAMLNAQLIHELREERTKLISREEEVRQQLNRDLHDGPAQALAALTMNVEFVRRLLERDPSRVPSELEKMRDLAQRTTRQVRTMLFELRPLTLESQGLVATLAEYLERFKDNPTQVILDDNGVQARLNDKREAGLFNILQESINNAVKHASAEHIWIRLREENGALLATVQDDGKGFDLQATKAGYSQRGSFGLLNIEERARLVGGTAEIHSAPGQGTTIRIVVPLDAA